ncbi:MAG: lipopolysaccharide transport periplasmic protein LptA [Deltaproteobacteria bacterium]|nr:lipopolysaccharide transport periplasmic protein LptA [Deltaproteobacteria bacterium]
MNTLLYKRWPGHICLVVSLALVALLFGWLFRAEAAPQTEDDVVHIVSDRLEAYEQQRQVIFIGNVVAKQGELTILGDRMTIFYLENKNPESNNEELGTKIDKIMVEGSVRITQKNVVATGERAVYFNEENKVVLTGEPKVQQEKNFIQGDKITLFLDSEKSIVEGGPSGPVEATIYKSASGGSGDRASGTGEGKSGGGSDTGG